jgi:hypothetical protein
MRNDEYGAVFTASLLLTAFTGGDILSLVSTNTSRAKLLKLELQQLSTAP